MNLLSESLPTN